MNEEVIEEDKEVFECKNTKTKITGRFNNQASWKVFLLILLCLTGLKWEFL